MTEVTTFDRVKSLLADFEQSNAQLCNPWRGARVLVALAEIYHPEEEDGDPENMIRDALADLRHACDLAGLDFFRQDRIARDNYQAECGEEGPATDITEAV